MKAYSLLIAVIITILSFPTHAQDWVKYESQNFTVYTDRSEWVVIEVIEALEIFRKIATQQLGLPHGEQENKKLTVIMFGNNREFVRLTSMRLAGRNTTGIYTQTQDGPRIVIGRTRRDLAFPKETLFYLYTRHLMTEHSEGFFYPNWYAVGLQNLLSTASIEGNSVVLGRRPEDAQGIRYIGTMPLRELLQFEFTASGPAQRHRFRATSWLLTHYLQIYALANNIDLAINNRAYLTRYHRGDDPFRAFEEEFKTSLHEFDQELQAYGRQRRITVTNWPRPELDLGLTKIFISEVEQKYILADLYFREGLEEIALNYLEGLGEQGDFLGEALSLQAIMLNHEQTTSQIAAKIARDAAEIAPDSAKVFGNLAHYEMDNYRYLTALGQYASALESLDRAEANARKGVALNSRELNALWYLAAALLVKDSQEEALKVLYQAREVSPYHIGVRIEIAKILLRSGDIAGAMPIIKSVIDDARTPEMAERLLMLVEQMNSGEVDLSQLDQIVSPTF